MSRGEECDLKNLLFYGASALSDRHLESLCPFQVSGWEDALAFLEKITHVTNPSGTPGSFKFRFFAPPSN